MLETTIEMNTSRLQIIGHEEVHQNPSNSQTTFLVS